VVRGHGQGLEVVEVRLDLRPGGHGEAELREDLLQLPPHEGQRVQAPQAPRPGGQRHVDLAKEVPLPTAWCRAPSRLEKISSACCSAAFAGLADGALVRAGGGLERLAEALADLPLLAGVAGVDGAQGLLAVHGLALQLALVAGQQLGEGLLDGHRGPL